jgi:hemolysin III
MAILKTAKYRSTSTAPKKPKPVRMYTVGEEIANAVTHGIGALLAIAGTVLLIVKAQGALQVVSFSIYGTTMLMLYVSSTMYHSLTHMGAKRVFQVLDHSSIFLLIAGSYTPFMLVSVQGTLGWSIWGLNMAFAVAGIIIEAVARDRFHKVQLVIYVLMGWMCVLAMPQLLESIPRGGVVLLIVGGLCYTGGIVFYVWKKLPYSHPIWHLFVLAGTVTHYLAVQLYVAG